MAIVRFLAAAVLPVLLLNEIAAQPLPAGFQRSDPITGVTQPSSVQFAHDGRVFVTEKGGKIWVYPNLVSSTRELVFDLGAEVHNFWDRGLLGFALDPRFPEQPYLYVQYAYNGGLFADLAPRWPGTGCPSPPGATADFGGCVVSGRVSRLTLNGNIAGNELVLVEDWFQQYPSHSIGTIVFGPDGYLYAGGGDGASFNWGDYGQRPNATFPDLHSPLNAANPTDQATNHGGSLRSQGLEVESQYLNSEVWLNGSIIRINPADGSHAPGNPLAGTGLSENAKRIIAYGLRNPYRFTVRPGSGEIWLGDVGDGTWEEINVIPPMPSTGEGSLLNFGWPCFEGRGHHGNFTGPICTALYSNDNTGGRTPHRPPWYTYVHQGSSDTTGLAFYEGDSYPPQYHNSLFAADNSRTVIFNIPFVDANADGMPDPPTDSTAAAFFGGSLAKAVQLIAGPGHDIFFTNLENNRISRLSYCDGCANLAPSAAIAIDASSSADGAPRGVGFSAANSVDPNAADGLTYAWDLDGDGVFADASGVTASAFFGADGVHEIAVQVSDGAGGVDVARMRVTVVNSAPSVSITAPSTGMTWSVGETIALAGTATDPEQGKLPADAFAWQVFREDCVNPDFSDCSETLLGGFGGASASFVAPEAAFPAYLRIVLTATDNGSLSDTKDVSIFPATADVILASVPPGLQLGFDGTDAVSPQGHTVIVNQGFEVSAAAEQTLGAILYHYSAWSDTGEATHVVHVATPGSTTLTASYAAPADIAVAIDDGLDMVNAGQSLTWTLTVDNPGVNALGGIALQTILPNALADPHWSCSATPGSACAASGSGAVADSLSLASGGRATYLLNATIDVGAVGTFTVTAISSLPPGYVNQSPANDSASDTDAVFGDVVFRDGFEVSG